MGIEQRITALEKRMGILEVPRGVLVFPEKGETDEQAMARAGMDPDDPSIMPIFIQFVEPPQRPIDD